MRDRKNEPNKIQKRLLNPVMEKALNEAFEKAFNSKRPELTKIEELKKTRLKYGNKI